MMSTYIPCATPRLAWARSRKREVQILGARTRPRSPRSRGCEWRAAEVGGPREGPDRSWQRAPGSIKLDRSAASDGLKRNLRPPGTAAAPRRGPIIAQACEHTTERLRPIPTAQQRHEATRGRFLPRAPSIPFVPPWEAVPVLSRPRQRGPPSSTPEHCLTGTHRDSPPEWRAHNSSPVLRAIEASVIVANRLDVEYEFVDALREFDCGILEGRIDEAACQR